MAGTPLDRVYRRLVVCDGMIAVVSWTAGWAVRRGLDGIMGRSVSSVEQHLLLLPLLVPLMIAANASRGLYRPPPALGRLREFQQIIQGVILGLIAAMTLSFTIKELDIARAVVFFSAALNFLLLIVSRGLVRRWVGERARAGNPLVRTAVVGSGLLAGKIIERMEIAKRTGHSLVGVIHSKEPASGSPAEDSLGTVNALPTILKDKNIHEVFFADPDLAHEELLEIIAACTDVSVTFKVVTDLFDVVALQGSIDEVAGIPVIEMGSGVLSPGESRAKRFMDIGLAVVLGILLLPVSLIIAVCIKLGSRGPVLFRQIRIGKDGTPFTMLKFRTMYADARPFERSPRDYSDPRITPVGTWLRRTSLDEVPQIINVLKSEMSFVGPRPEMPFIVENYEGWQRQRLNVKPGITGLWQIMGRMDLPLEENLEYDFYYIRNQSILLDISILLRTIPTVLLGKGAY